MTDDARAAAVAEEQRQVDRAYARLSALRARAEQRRREALAAPVVTHADLVNRDAAAFQAANRLRSLTLGDEEPLVFGRLDLDGGDRHHIGRVSVLSEEYEPLVVDWRSDVAAAFYRATPNDPQGVHRRRIIQCRGPRVLHVEDQLLDLEADVGDDVVGDAALMAAITRERSTRMHDIVATIQREQDEIIRLPARGMVVVTGGPGTGKTAVALHRVAYLLYRHRDRLERRGVLVVGPTRAFADYIASVLPSLGETTAVLRPLGSFVAGVTTDRHDRREVAAVKGDARMGELVRRYADRVPPSRWRVAFERLRAGEVDLVGLGSGLLGADALRLMAHSWADDVRTERPWTVEDVAIADELRAALGVAQHEPTRATEPADVDEVTTWADRSARIDPGAAIAAPDYAEFGHVVVDEAQDLSVLQWRMVARRAREAGWTVVGDLAQSSTPGAPRSWEEVVDLVGQRESHVRSLSVNYRTSSAIMDLAARLLAEIAPGQEAPRSARTTDLPPVVRTDVPDPVEAAVAAARDHRAGTAGTVAVIAASPLVPGIADGLGGDEVRVLDPWTAKGLEFDAVVVVEPAAIIDEVGYGALYVALTRATTSLTVVTAEPKLPDPLL